MARGTGDATVEVKYAGTILNVNNTGNAPGGVVSGIRAHASTTGQVTVKTAATINVTGDTAHGIYTTAASGSTAVTNTGKIKTSGTSSHGIYSVNGSGGATILNTGTITTSGDTARAIQVSSPVGGGNINVSGSGALSTAGYDSHGIATVASGGNTVINYSGDITGNGSNIDGIYTVASDATNTISITASGRISLEGGATGIANYGIVAQTHGGDINVTYTGPQITSNTGTGGAGIMASTRLAVGGVAGTGLGTITIANSGAIATNGLGTRGITTYTNTGVTTINNTGRITTAQDRADGIYAASTGGAINITNTGALTTTGDSASGIAASTLGGPVTIVNSGALTTSGSGSAGISATGVDGSIAINNSGAITTGKLGVGTGNNSPGIYAYLSGSGNVLIENSGDIDTSGTPDSQGILGITASGSVTIKSVGANITTHDNNGVIMHGVEAKARSGDATVLFRDGTVKVGGNSVGLAAWNELSGAPGTATVHLENGRVDATNTYGGNSGIMAVATDSGYVSIDSTSIVQGGWFNSAAGYSASVGVLLGGSRQTLVNAGTIEAMSDLSVLGDLGSAGTLSIANSGTITGYVTAATSAVTFDNAGLWNLRNFADTNGDKVRDHFAIAVSNLGTSGNNTINNTGTIRVLGHDHLAQTLDTTGMYLPEGNAFNTMSLNSPTQAHILGVQTFTNNGVIDLTANSSVGDVLVITGGQVAGTNGGGTFVTGGSLHLNTVLNEGGANSQSDVLVVDNTQVGSAATSIIITATGTGAQTVDNGILVVDVLGNSAAGAFRLGARAAAGLYEYDLAHVGNNWYLQNAGIRDEIPVINTTPVALVDMGSSFLNGLGGFGGILSGYGYGFDGVHRSARFDGMGSGRQQAGQGAGEGGTETWCRDPKDPHNAKLQYRCVIPMPKLEEVIYRGAWGRILGESGEQTSRNTSKYGSRYEYDMFGFQAGMDVYGYETTAGSLNLFGIYGGYGRSTYDVKGSFGSGKIGKNELDGYSFGAYWTHQNVTGWNTTAIVQGTQYDVDMTSYHGNNTFSRDAFGFAASLEGGYTFSFGNGFMVEPQAQIIYQNINIDKVWDNFSRLDTDDINSTRGRLGFKAGYDYSKDFTVWGVTNVWHEFGSDIKTTLRSDTGLFQGVTSAPIDGTWLEVGLGASGRVTDNISLTAQGSYNYGLDNNDKTSWTGTVGIKVTW